MPAQQQKWTYALSNNFTHLLQRRGREGFSPWHLFPEGRPPSRVKLQTLLVSRTELRSVSEVVPRLQLSDGSRLLEITRRKTNECRSEMSTGRPNCIFWKKEGYTLSTVETKIMTFQCFGEKISKPFLNILYKPFFIITFSIFAQDVRYEIFPWPYDSKRARKKRP